MSEPVRFERIDDVGVVTLDNPPVNALSLELRRAVKEAFDEGLGDEDVVAFVLAGSGRMFSAGADITEFESGRSNEPPTLRDLIDLVEGSPKPVVAAMHGNAMGGGLELPLACHARVATEGTRIGLPEVNIGIVPGAGGTQRLPRVVGVRAALDIIVSGKPITAEKAHEIGLVDDIVHEGGDLIATAVELAQALAARDAPPPKTRDRKAHLAEAEADPSVFDDYRKSIARRARGYEAPFACIDCVEAAVQQPFEAGLAFERDTFQRLRTSDQAKALRHVFFAERQASKVRGVDRATAEYPVRKGAVLGCGTMGGGIAMCFANAGIPVTVREHDQAALDRGMEIIRKNYAATVSKGRMKQDAMDACMARITPTLDLEAAVEDADIVIEAVFEDMDLKKEIFARLDELCDSNTVLATNTSSLDVNEIAAVTKRPEDVLGLHFFSPANVMKLLEIVRAEKTSPEVLATALTVSKRLGKVGVVVGVCDSFAANRSLYAYTRQAGFLLEEGALPEQVDRVIYEFGFPMGPFAVGDLAGIDVGYKIRQHRGRPEGRYSDIADKLYEMGRYGQKTNAGWFKYEEGSRTPIPDPVVTDLIVETSKELGIERREISDEEILQRCMYPMINEGARILEEGIVQRASDFDLVWLYGYGFPRYRGGPMFWADQLGLDHVYEVMQGFYEQHHDWLEPAPLLAKLAKEGGTFGEWSPE